MFLNSEVDDSSRGLSVTIPRPLSLSSDPPDPPGRLRTNPGLPGPFGSPVEGPQSSIRSSRHRSLTDPFCGPEKDATTRSGNSGSRTRDLRLTDPNQGRGMSDRHTGSGSCTHSYSFYYCRGWGDSHPSNLDCRVPFAILVVIRVPFGESFTTTAIRKIFVTRPKGDPRGGGGHLYTKPSCLSVDTRWCRGTGAIVSRAVL